MNKKEIEAAADKTIEDLKQIFRFRRANSLTKIKTLFIPENKIGVLRYLMIKNLESESRH